MSAVDLSSVQSDAKVNLYQNGEGIDFKPVSPFYEIIQKVDPLLVGRFLGETGVNLRSFASSIDLEHPEVGSLFDGKIDTLYHLFQMGQFSDSIQAYNTFRAVLHSLIVEIKENFVSLPVRNAYMGQPTTLARLLKTKEMRDKARLTKNIQAVELGMFYRKGSPSWDESPATFLPYVRHSNASAEEIERVRARRATLAKLGLNNLSVETGRAIEAYERLRAESYLGFRKLPMTAATVILAKTHGFVFDPNNGYIRVDKKSLNAWEFNSNKKKTREDDYIAARRDVMPYAPRLYPYSKLAHLASEDCKKMIAHLESAPEMKGKPLFDHYIVIVPSVDVSQSLNYKMSLTKKNGEVVNYKNQEEAQIGFDQMLIAEKCVNPIILAERDGKCHFVSYFE